MFKCILSPDINTEEIIFGPESWGKFLGDDTQTGSEEWVGFHQDKKKGSELYSLSLWPCHMDCIFISRTKMLFSASCLLHISFPVA